MSVLVDELLLLAQLDAGRPLAAEPVDLSRLAIDGLARSGGRWCGLFFSLGHGMVVTLIGIVVALIVYLLAGIRASQETGRVGTGAFAGLWTGVVSVIIGFLGVLLLAYLHLGTLRQQAGAAAQTTANQLHLPLSVTTDQLLLSTAAVTVLTGLIFSVLLGLILGAIGGLIGRGRASRKTLVSQEATYHDVPTPPQSR